MADVQPYRFARYAAPSEAVVAPPYDVISAAEREEHLARDPHNVVHLTLDPSEEAAGARFRQWLAEGVLVRDPEPAAWVVAQDYVGPDGVARTRRGLVASLGVEPYATGTVLPHERTHAGPKASRLRLLRAAQAQLEPIFLLYDGEPPLADPGSRAGPRRRRERVSGAPTATALPELLRRPAAADRRRASSLRDGGRLRRRRPGTPRARG